MKHLSLAALMVVLLGSGSCGGGGGGTLGAQTFSGTYWVVLFTAEGNPVDVESVWGTATADGVSAITFNPIGGNSNQTVTTTVPSFAQEYTVDPDGTLRFLLGATEVTRGGVTSDGACAVLSNVFPVGSPQCIVLVRKGGAFSAASLTGIFNVLAVGSASPPATLWAEVDFDGVSMFMGSGNTNQGGAVGGGPFNDTFTVAGDGASTIDIFGETQSGGLVAGATFGIAGGGTTNGDDPLMSFLVRGGTGLNDSALSGEYWVTGIESDPGTAFTSFSGTISANGAGALSIAATQFDEISVSPLAGAATYSVAADGILTVNRTGLPLENIRGAVSPDGRFAVMVGGSENGSRPILMVLCRK